MGSTTGRTLVRVGGSFDQQCQDTFLGAREHLPRGLNGHVAHAPPEHIANTRKRMTQGLCVPFHHIVSVGDEMIDVGVPYTEVNAALEMICRRNQARALDRHVARERPVPVLLTGVQKEIAEYQLAALKLANSPESLEAAQTALREARDIPVVLEEFSLAVVRTTTRRAYGTRPSFTLESRS